jgi:TrpR family transcriptional regulator, trp operon repressor
MKTDDPRVEINLDELASALAGTNDPVLIRDFLYCLLTPAEIADIAARWALVKELKRRTPQREIAKDLGVSLCKITRGSRELKKPGSAFQRILAARECDQKGKLYGAPAPMASGSFEVQEGKLRPSGSFEVQA